MLETLLSLEACLDRLEGEMHSLDAQYAQRMRLAVTDRLVFVVYAEKTGKSYTVLAEGQAYRYGRKSDVLSKLTDVFSGVRPPEPVNAGYFRSLKLQLGNVLMAMVYYNSNTKAYNIITSKESMLVYGKQGVIPKLEPYFTSPEVYS